MSGKTYDEDDLQRVAGIFSEQIKGQLDAVMEAVGDMRGKVARIPTMAEKVDRLESDMKTVKAAVIDTNHNLHQLETEVEALKLGT